MNYLVVIPARGGSKGVKKKNIYPVCGHPMIFYTLNLLMNSSYKGDVFVSTDDDEIIRVSEDIIGKREKYYVVKRPAEYAIDEASTEVVAEHALKYMKKTYGKEYDAIIIMPPNQPMRTEELFYSSIKEFERMPDKFDTLNTFIETREDLFRKESDGEFIRVNKDAPRRRQDRTPMYIETGAMIITKVESFFRTGSLWGNHIYGYVIDEITGLDVHDKNDINYLEYLLSEEK